MNLSPVRYLVLWLTTACNLHCRYCYRKAEEAAAMPRDIAEAALSLAGESGRPFHVQLAGGEPALEPGLIEFVGQIVRRNRWPATLALQTNGTLLDRRLADLCRRYDIGIGISLDGPPGIQEQARGGSGATFQGLALLETMGIPIRVTTVLSSFNEGRLSDLAFVLARFRNIRGMGLDPLVVTGEAERRLNLSSSLEAVRSGVHGLLQAMEQMRGDYGVSIDWRELDAVRRSLLGNEPVGSYCHASRGESLAVHPNGTAYPCGQTIGDPEMAVGTVDSIDWARLKATYQNVQLRGNCTPCPLNGRCPGDCPSRLHYNKGKDSPVMCIVYQAIAEKLIEK